MIPNGISNGKQQANDAFAEEHAKRIENCGRTEVNQGEITATAKKNTAVAANPTDSRINPMATPASSQRSSAGVSGVTSRTTAIRANICRWLYVVPQGKANATSGKAKAPARAFFTHALFRGALISAA